MAKEPNYTVVSNSKSFTFKGGKRQPVIHQVRDYSATVLTETFPLLEKMEREEGSLTSLPAELGRIHTYSPDLKDFYVLTSWGTALKLEPSTVSFFSWSPDDEFSYKLICRACLTRYTGRQGRPVCVSCQDETYGIETPVYWLPPSGQAYAVAKSKAAEERAGGAFPVPSSDEIAEAVNKHDFVEDLISWVNPYQDDPLKGHLLAWDLIDVLDELWLAWKAVKRFRKVETKLAGYRAIASYWNDPEAALWLPTTPPITGSSVTVTQKG